MYDALVYMMGTMKVLARSISLKGKLFSYDQLLYWRNY